MASTCWRRMRSRPAINLQNSSVELLTKNFSAREKQRSKTRKQIGFVRTKRREEMKKKSGKTVWLTTRWSRMILVALILVLGMSAAYTHASAAAAQPRPAASQAAPKAGDLVDINSGDERSIESAAGHRRCVFAEDHRQPSVSRQNRSAEQEDRAGGDLRKNQGPDHRQTAQVLTSRESGYPRFARF